MWYIFSRRSFFILQSNGIVTIFHRTHQSFMMAEGSLEDGDITLPNLEHSRQDNLHSSFQDLESAILKTMSPKLSRRTSIQVTAEVHDLSVNTDKRTKSTQSLLSIASPLLTPRLSVEEIDQNVAETDATNKDHNVNSNAGM